MNRNTIKWRIFKYNLVAIMMLITLTTIIFNVAVRLYIEKDVLNQMGKIASSTTNAALRHGPDLFHGQDRMPPPPNFQNENDIVRFYFMLDRTLKDQLTVLNADYILLDKDKNRILPFKDQSFRASSVHSDEILNELSKLKDFENETYLKFHISGTEYITVIKKVSDRNSFGLGWIIMYSSLEKVYQLQLYINVILFSILIFSSLIIVFFSSLLSKKISAPFSTMNQHIRAIAERKFGTKLHMPVDDELKEFVTNINLMSEKLEIYDKAQKTFLQNVSHEFRTPLMSIQSYAEGITYEVIDNDTAANVIIDETKRLTHLVEDLLYLSRLDTIEESYKYEEIYLNEILEDSVGRLKGIAIQNKIHIVFKNTDPKILIYGDREKLSRAITNIISNCIRYAETEVKILLKITREQSVSVIISDDGPGFEEKDLLNIFERFYKGKKGKFGLGLAISKNIIEKHSGNIFAQNAEKGAQFILQIPILH